MQSGTEHAFWDTRVVACSIDYNAVRWKVVHTVDDGIGELDFAACATALLTQEVEDAWLESVPPDDCEVARGIFAFGFFDHLFDGDDVWFDRWSGDDAFGVNVVP